MTEAEWMARAYECLEQMLTEAEEDVILCSEEELEAARERMNWLTWEVANLEE
jgi:hypothetical protein